MRGAATKVTWAESWQGSWDRLDEGYVPGREALVGGLVDLVEATVGDHPTVLDLGCGTGTVALRLLARLPRARVLGVDIDPVLLTIARATFAEDERVRLVSADLRDASWSTTVKATEVDAIVSTTALHWLSEPTVGRLYHDLAGLVRPNGVFARAEVMPMTERPRLDAAFRAFGRGRVAAIRTDGRPNWDEWWAQAATDSVLAAAAGERRQVFETNYPVTEFSPPAEWHIAALEAAGFIEAGVVWRSGRSAIVAAVRP